MRAASRGLPGDRFLTIDQKTAWATVVHPCTGILGVTRLARVDGALDRSAASRALATVQRGALGAHPGDLRLQLGLVAPDETGGGDVLSEGVGLDDAHGPPGNGHTPLLAFHPEPHGAHVDG